MYTYDERRLCRRHFSLLYSHSENLCSDLCIKRLPYLWAVVQVQQNWQRDCSSPQKKAAPTVAVIKVFVESQPFKALFL